jgi:hypothetical protein
MVTSSPSDLRQPLTYVAAAAVLVGIWARLWHLGSAPFAVDEYYLAQSIENILRTGLPAFPCGGYYPRGIVLQYIAAALRLLGSSAELAPRLISALSSIAALPAVYLLGRRLQGRVIALLGLTIVALSVWEIEMARFGRMYAPFQTVFLWYLVYFLRYTVDREIAAFWPMLLLSLAGPLVWEGGVFLPLANLMAVCLLRWPERLKRADWVRLVLLTVLLVASVLFVTADFRGYVAESWPAGYVRALSMAPPDPISTLRLRMPSLGMHPWMIVAALLIAAALALALRWLWGQRSLGPGAIALLAALPLAATHQFLAVGAILVLLLLTRLITWRELFNSSATPYHLTLLLCLGAWIALGIYNSSPDILPLPRRAAMVGYQLLGFPNFVEVVARPWASAIPRLAAGLVVLFGIALYRACRLKVSESERIVLVVLVVLLLAASASHPPRQETRYVFFLFPVLLLIALATLAQAIARLRRVDPSALGPAAAVLLAICSLGAFALSEDFQPVHVIRIDTPEETFRRNFNQAMQSHLVIRDDYRAVAGWLENHRKDGHVVVNGVHGLDHYFPAFNYFFVDQHDPNFPDWSCRRGTIERWGNYPLLNSVDQLDAVVARYMGGYLVAFGYNIDQIMASLSALHPRIALAQDNIVVLELRN